MIYTNLTFDQQLEKFEVKEKPDCMGGEGCVFKKCCKKYKKPGKKQCKSCPKR